MLFGRIDYQDKNKRLREKSMEFVWESSSSLGKTIFYVTKTGKIINFITELKNLKLYDYIYMSGNLFHKGRETTKANIEKL